MASPNSGYDFEESIEAEEGDLALQHGGGGTTRGGDGLQHGAPHRSALERQQWQQQREEERKRARERERQLQQEREQERERQFQEQLRAIMERAQEQDRAREEREREREQQMRLEAREREQQLRQEARETQRQMRLEMQQEMDRLHATLVAQGSSGGQLPAQLPASSVGQLPAPSVGQLPAPSIGQLPAQSVGQLPAPPAGQLPAQSVGQLPAPPAGQLPAQSVGQLPAPPAGQLPALLRSPAAGQLSGQLPMRLEAEAQDQMVARDDLMDEDDLLEDRDLPAPTSSTVSTLTNKRRLLIIDSDEDEPTSDQEEDEDDFSPKLEEFGDTLISPYGTSVSIQSVCPLNVSDLGNLMCEPGSHVVKAPVQSGKSIAIATMCYASHLLGKPTIVIVGDVKKHIKGSDGLEGKLNVVLQKFGCDALCLEPGTKFPQRSTDADNFLNGKLVLVAQFHHHHLGKLRQVIEDIKKEKKIEISDATVILDEGDVMWSRTPDSEHRTLRDSLLYQVVDLSVAGNLVHVSATHFATIGWHSMGADAIAYDVIIADKARLAEAGYTLSDDLTPFVVDGQPVYLPPDVFGTQKNRFLSGCSEVHAFMDLFDRDDRDNRFMQVALTSLIDGGRDSECTTVSLAQDLASRCKRTAAQGKRVVVLIACSGPVRMFVDGQDLSGDLKRNAKTTVPAAINFVYQKYHKQYKLILAGYACVLRGVSPMSSDCVITHMLLAPSKTMSSADLEQAACRACGKNSSTRAANNHDPTGQHPHYKPSDVVVLMRQKDLELVKSLPQMTEDALRACGTGKEADVNNWRSMQFPPEVDPALLCGRPPANGALGKRVDMGLAPAKATARRRRTEAEKQAKRQRTVAAHAVRDEPLQLEVLRVLAAAPNQRMVRAQLNAALPKQVVADLGRNTLPRMRDVGLVDYAGSRWSITAAGLAKLAAAPAAPAAPAQLAVAPAALALTVAAAAQPSAAPAPPAMALAVAATVAPAQLQQASMPQGSPQQQVLLILASALPNHMTAAEIHTAMPGTITEGRLATILDRMVDKGLVQRPRSRTGGWSLTNQGQSAAARGDWAATDEEEEKEEGQEEDAIDDVMHDVLGSDPSMSTTSVLFTLRLVGKSSSAGLGEFAQRACDAMAKTLAADLEVLKQDPLVPGSPAFKTAAAAVVAVANEEDVQVVVEQGPAHTRCLVLAMIHQTRIQRPAGHHSCLYTMHNSNLIKQYKDKWPYEYELTAAGLYTLQSSLQEMSE